MRDLSGQLPGRWLIRATNFPMWLSKKRSHPSITYELLDTNPLALADLVEYRDRRGREKSIEGVDTATCKGFEWQGNGVLKLLSSQWKVAGVEDNVLAIRFERSLLTPAGVDVLVREGRDVPNLRRQLVDSPESLGLSAEDVDSLSWL